MKTNIQLPLGVNPAPFNRQFTEHFSNNLSAALQTSISNLLAIDYAGRLNSEPQIDHYIDVCIKRLKDYLGPKVILSEDFADSMTLFTVAIAPEKDLNDTDQKSQEQSQDALIDSIIASCFGVLTPSEQQTIKTILKDLLNGKDGKELLGLVTTDPKIFYSIVIQAISAKKHQQEVSGFVEMHLKKILDQTKELNKKTDGIKNVIGKLVLAGSVLLAASIGLLVGGFALPALVLPTAITAIKYAPKIGEALGKTIESNSTLIQKESKLLAQLKSQHPLLEQSKTLENVLAQKNTISQTQVQSIKETLRTKPHDNSIELPISRAEKTVAQKDKSPSKARY